MYAPHYAETLLDSCDARRGAFLRRKYSARIWIFRTPGSGISPTLSWYSQDCLSPVSRQTLDRETLSARRFSRTKERMSVFIAPSSQNIEHCATNTLSVTIAMSLRVAPWRGKRKGTMPAVFLGGPCKACVWCCDQPDPFAANHAALPRPRPTKTHRGLFLWLIPVATAMDATDNGPASASFHE